MSYIFKPLSLLIRLFANMVAGHTLLKIVAGFIGSLSLQKIFILYYTG